MSRPLLYLTGAELRKLVNENSEDAMKLKQISEELGHRTTNSARELAEEVCKMLAASKSQRSTLTSNLLLGDYETEAGMNEQIDVANLTGVEPVEDCDGIFTSPHVDTSDWREDTEFAISRLRRKLIDLSRRNPLISFRHSGTSATTIRIVDERPDLVFEHIGRSAYRFEGLPDQDEIPQDELTPEFQIAFERALITDEEYLAEIEALGDAEEDAAKMQTAERRLRARVRAALGLPVLSYGKGLDVRALAKAHGFDSSYELKFSDEHGVEDHHEDDRLRTLLVQKDLQKKLKGTWEKYRLHLRETGLHTLYLAMGFVEWFEDGKAQANHAPVLLMAVELDRKIVRGKYEYMLSSHDDGVQVNVALAEKMKEHWGLDMPSLREDETPESYFIRLQEVLAKGEKLSLRNFITLCVLPFPKMVLWKDLDPDSWQESAFARHRLLPGLMGTRPMAGTHSSGANYDIDGPEWAERAPNLIRPADASQHSALIEVAEGADLAIEGPPGTGKSETITNLIATSLAAGKTVLFVAEKQAALRVVADRLTHSGLGPLLLELHGEQAKRSDVYDSLRERLRTEARSNAYELRRQRDELKKNREALRRYLALIRTNLGDSDKTAYEVLWRRVLLADRTDREHLTGFLENWSLPEGAERPSDLADVRGRLDVFAKALDEVASAANGAERTDWLLAQKLPPFDQEEQLAAAAAVAQAAAQIADWCRMMENVGGFSLPTPGQDFSQHVAQLEQLPTDASFDEQVLMAALRRPEETRQLLLQQTRWRQLCDRLGSDLASPHDVEERDIDHLASILATVETIPTTVSEARSQLADLSNAKAAFADASGARKRLVSLFDLREDRIDVHRLTAICDVFCELGAQKPAIAALLQTGLIDPLAATALESEKAKARLLTEKSDALAAELKADALSSDPAELLEIAETLEDSGLFARVFSKDYKKSHKRASRLLRDAADREQSVERLRDLSGHISQLAKFSENSAARHYIPSALWEGCESDWENVDAAQALLCKARASLADQEHGELLRHWLILDTEQRERCSGAAAALRQALTEVADAGFPEATIANLQDMLERQHKSFADLAAALDRLNALEGGCILRDEENLAERFKGLWASRDSFDRLRSIAELGWVTDVSQSLDTLARANVFADGLRQQDDHLGLMAVMKASNRPCSLFASVVGNRDAGLHAFAAWQGATAKLLAMADLPVHSLVRDDVADPSRGWPPFQQRLERLAVDRKGAQLAADLRRYESGLHEHDLEYLSEQAIAGVIPSDQLADIYELAVMSELFEEYIGDDGKELGRQGGLSQESARRKFVETDKRLHQLESEAILAQRLADQAEWGIDFGPKGQWTENALLSSELGLQRPRTPLRDVIHRAGGAMQTLKPVWMMSPASAAQYIRPHSLEFDLLVVDEASQMRPEYAISAILRGKQFVVVGDAKQLPPSDHFKTKSEIADDDDQVGLDEDTESILDVANQRFRRKRRLKWHYRSQHESLINFSNREFYEKDLVVFPSPSGDADDSLGVHCIYVPGLHDDTVYEASVNQREAEAVIEEALRMMTLYPERSLGIAAMNAAQTALIQNELDRLTLDNRVIRDYVERWADTIDEFFIKNLENVQGDERDTIIISTVYGPDRNGVVAQRFGLMNQEVGWRRLNVLVTRAKMSTRLVTSLRPADVKVTESSSLGLKALKAYLTYAQGGATVDNAAGGDEESPFEEFVATALKRRGFEIVPQVGVEGFRIDFGVQHPDYPIGFIAGIECDGARFHSGMTVRDRDRIRQAQLENLGWHIYRIWSVDWFASPEREMQKLDTWLDQRLRQLQTAYRKPKNPDAVAANDLGARAPEPETQEASIGEDRAEPYGSPMRPVDKIEWYEVEKGRHYEIWPNGRFVGTVTVLSRATDTPRVYGTHVHVERSEYEGVIEATGETFRTHDIYSAVRRIGKAA